LQARLPRNKRPRRYIVEVLLLCQAVPFERASTALFVRTANSVRAMALHIVPSLYGPVEVHFNIHQFL
jgi:hypothetical protein